MNHAPPPGHPRTNSLFQLLSELVCPYCGNRFEISHDRTVSNPQSESDPPGSGILNCECYEYPIVDGIPIIQQIDGLSSVTSLVKEGNATQALLQALNLFRITWAQRSRWHQVHYHLNCRRLISDKRMAFTTAAQLARRPKVFADYLVHRYANTSFLSAIGPLLLIRSLVNIGQSDDGMPPRVLDVGCGAGHATFLMSLLYPETSIVSADQDFVNVYLARRFLAPEAIHLCIDAEVPVPFPDNSFDAVFCLDAFHYLRSKKAIVTELTRILKASGAWVFPHLHNKLQPNFTAGIPLSPEGYLKCFEAANPKLFDEAAVLRSLSAGRPPDWQTGSDPRDLTGCPNLTMIGGLRGDAEINSSSLAALNPISQYLQINPIFKVHRTRSAFRASFEWPNKVMASECAAVEEFIPSEVELTPDSLGKLQRGNWDWEDPEVRGLITRFVAVPLPSRYTPHTVPAGNDGG